jgi:hypothetical protein
MLHTYTIVAALRPSGALWSANTLCVMFAIALVCIHVAGASEVITTGQVLASV